MCPFDREEKKSNETIFNLMWIILWNRGLRLLLGWRRWWMKWISDVMSFGWLFPKWKIWLIYIFINRKIKLLCIVQWWSAGTHNPIKCCSNITKLSKLNAWTLSTNWNVLNVDSPSFFRLHSFSSEKRIINASVMRLKKWNLN